MAEPTRGRHTWQGESPLMGCQCVAGAGFEETHPDGNLDVAAPNFGTKDPSELAGAGFEESTLMGTSNVAGPNFGRKDRSERATRGRRTWQGEGPLLGSQRVAGASFEETTLMGTYNVAGPNFGRKDPSELLEPPLWEPITWQGQTWMERPFRGGRCRFRRNHPYGNL